MESVRKDIECFFGRLKVGTDSQYEIICYMLASYLTSFRSLTTTQGRFRILKMPILLHDKKDIDNVFFTCVALQNIIATWDGKDEWQERGVSWDKSDGQFEDTDEDQVNWARPKIFRNGEWVNVKPGDDFSNIGRVGLARNQQVLWGEPGGGIPSHDLDLQRLVELHTENDVKFRDLQKKLVKNFNVRARLGSNFWLRS